MFHTTLHVLRELNYTLASQIVKLKLKPRVILRYHITVILGSKHKYIHFKTVVSVYHYF